jgi:hypothetical protein
MPAEAEVNLPVFTFRQAGKRYVCRRLLAGFQGLLSAARGGLRGPGTKEITMLLRYAFLAAAALCVTGTAEAQAQSPFPPVGQQASPFPPVGQQASPFPPAGATVFGAPAQQQEVPPCFKDFIPLREEMEKRFEAVKTMMEKRPSASEACSALTRFTQAEVALLKFVEKNSPTCSFPPGMLDNIKASNAKSEGYKKQACTVAAQQQQRPARAAEPTLSDAFGGPALNKDTTRTGRGTFDSLSGNPLAR